MTAVIIQLRDYARPPARCVVREDGGEVVILPVIRVERLVEAMLKPVARPRRSLLGDPA